MTARILRPMRHLCSSAGASPAPTEPRLIDLHLALPTSPGSKAKSGTKTARSTATPSPILSFAL